jgi:hypothetical protein
MLAGYWLPSLTGSGSRPAILGVYAAPSYRAATMSRAPGWDDDPWERLRYCVQQVESYRGFENYVIPPDEDAMEAERHREQETEPPERPNEPGRAFTLAAGERLERGLSRLWDEMEREREAASKAKEPAQREPSAAHTPSRSRWKRRFLLGLVLRRWRR